MDCSYCLTIWFLYFFVGLHEPVEFGQYATRARCERAAREQLPYAIMMMGSTVSHRCSTRREPSYG